MRSDKIVAIVVLIALSGLLSGGCGEQPNRSGMDGSRNSASNSNGVREPSGRAETAPVDDFGDDWLQAERLSVTTEGQSESADGDRSTWTINLKTFTGARSAGSARTMTGQLTTLDPRFGNGAWIHQTTDGAAVVYGRYASVEDPRAQEDLRWIKSFSINGQPILRGAMLTRVVVGGARQSFGRFELLSVRKQYPAIDPLYTLQIEVWGSFGARELTWDEVRRSAEQRVRELRGENVLAFYHHDFDQQISMVTVGLFDHTSFDPQTYIGLDPTLIEYRERFQDHLMNGAPVDEVLSAKVLIKKKHPQRSRLVIVPKL